MIRPRLTLAVVAVAGALAGCTLGPDYVRPAAQIQLPAQYAAAPLAASPAIASNWWTLFGDARLDELVRQALATSPDAMIAAARIEEADAVLRQVDAALLPQVNANASTGRARTILPNTTPPKGQIGRASCRERVSRCV